MSASHCCNLQRCAGARVLKWPRRSTTRRSNAPGVAFPARWRRPRTPTSRCAWTATSPAGSAPTACSASPNLPTSSASTATASHSLPSLCTAQQRSAAIAAVARAARGRRRAHGLARRTLCGGVALGAPPWFEVERAAARYFGVHTHAAHANGLVRESGPLAMWIARRSPVKAIDPGLLDNLVGGGIAAGATVAETVVKEAWEEAGIPASLAAQAGPASAGCASAATSRTACSGRRSSCTTCGCPRTSCPRTRTAKRSSIDSCRRAKPPRSSATRTGADVMTADAGLVALDALLRHATLTRHAAWRERLAALAQHPAD